MRGAGLGPGRGSRGLLLWTPPFHLCTNRGTSGYYRRSQYVLKAQETSAEARPVPNQATPGPEPTPSATPAAGAFGERLAASTGAPLQRDVPHSRDDMWRSGEVRASARVRGARGDPQRCSARPGRGAERSRRAAAGARGSARRGPGALGKFALAAWGGDAALAFRACQPGDSGQRRRRMHRSRQLASRGWRAG